MPVSVLRGINPKVKLTLKDCWLVGKDPAKLLAEAGRVDGG